MTDNHTSPAAAGATTVRLRGRDGIARLFAAALEGDRRAEAALHLLGGFDERAHRASWALLTTDQHAGGPMPPDVLASIERTLARLQQHLRDGAAA